MDLHIETHHFKGLSVSGYDVGNLKARYASEGHWFWHKCLIKYFEEKFGHFPSFYEQRRLHASLANEDEIRKKWDVYFDNKIIGQIVESFEIQWVGYMSAEVFAERKFSIN